MHADRQTDRPLVTIVRTPTGRSNYKENAPARRCQCHALKWRLLLASEMRQWMQLGMQHGVINK